MRQDSKSVEECPRVFNEKAMLSMKARGKRGDQIKGMPPRWGGFWEDEGGGSKVPAAAAGPSLDSSGSDLFLN